jgi:hypothetical protein
MSFGLISLAAWVSGCASAPADFPGLEQTSVLPSPACQRLGRIEGKSYWGAGVVGQSNGHYHARKAAIDEAPAGLVAQATHVVWEPPSGFGVDVAAGLLFRCPKG